MEHLRHSGGIFTHVNAGWKLEWTGLHYPVLQPYIRVERPIHFRGLARVV